MKMFFLSLMRRCFFFPKRLFFWWRRREVEHSNASEPILALGRVLENRTVIHGGAVKLLALRDAFSINEKKSNILYLVSSAQPPFSQDLVKKARRCGMIFVWNQNGVGYPAWAGEGTEGHNAPMRRLRALADYVIYQSAFCRESAEFFLGPCLAPSEILFNPIDLGTYFPSPIRPPLSPLRLLTLGTHGYAERVFSTLECLKNLVDAGCDAVLTIAGKCEWPQGVALVKREIGRLGLTARVTLLPPFSQGEAVRLYQSHHIVLHPKYLDPCPTVVLEALASGCPVVGSASGGLLELVDEESGVLIPAPLDWSQMITPTGAALAKGVLKIVPHFESYAYAARIRAEALFDQKRWVARHQEIFISLLRNRRIPL
ncbi:MAG: glycosyltransferase family 4 protein [Verrucomicrobia bacterium]|jgi:glycosyltransferase involved in cell wall biosynthesis|nr:MAG: glycosyltransferase family 4 protein [Verrucomicrobiota bacterium]